MENKSPPAIPSRRAASGRMLLFALPIMLGSLLQQLYNTADAVIVGRALGKAALASVGGSSPVSPTCSSMLFVALSSGARASSSRSTSTRGTRSACAGASAAICSFRWSAAFFSRSIGITSARQLLGVDADHPRHSTPPPPICASSSSAWCRPCSTTWAAASPARDGRLKRPLYYLFVCVVANIALDLLFVIVFNGASRDRRRDRSFAGRVRGAGRARPAAAARGAASALRP